MQLKLLLQRIRRVWITTVKANLAYLTISTMMTKRFSREWDDYPWRVTETLRFKCLSLTVDMYQVERIITKKYYLPNGEVKTEVEDRTHWQASLTSSYVLFENGKKDRLIAFIPENWTVLFEDNEYTEVCND
jgi:hypothetical protein